MLTATREFEDRKLGGKSLIFKADYEVVMSGYAGEGTFKIYEIKEEVEKEKTLLTSLYSGDTNKNIIMVIFSDDLSKIKILQKMKQTKHLNFKNYQKNSDNKYVRVPFL